MKKILVTGKGSYIGTNFKQFMTCYSEEYQVDELDMMDESWSECDFSKYNVIFHVAGIAHIKEMKGNAELYYKVNRDLAIETANMARQQGVEQFVFMSSMSVYGLEHSKKTINLSTPTNPVTNYGKSKLEAEKKINQLSNDFFKVAILRPPMVYGEDSPGNLTKLFKLVRKIHIFPKIKNERSSIAIENLCESIFDIIRNKESGIFLPQNSDYMCTYEIVKEYAYNENIKVIFTPVFNPIIKLCIGKISILTKCFGDLKYGK